jgi:thiosulfate/3-mercaptopyruvate sulfurtransferase
MTDTSDADFIIDTGQLADQLADADLRIYDASVVMQPGPGGGYEVRSGFDEYQQAHIPGAAFLDLKGDLSAPDQQLLFMLPSAAQFAAAVGKAGISNDLRVVLYNRGPSWWATRLWFMLEHFGYTAARVLDGGLDKWRSEGRPVEAGVNEYPAADFQIRAGRRNFVDKDEMFARHRAPGVVTLNALAAAQHRGDVNPYGRPGRIPGSRHAPAAAFLNEDGTFQRGDALATLCQATGADSADEVIAYCGGGISATTTAFALRLAGKQAVRIYDGSMSEWARDPDMPLAVGEDN